MTMRCRNWSETEILCGDALALSGLSHQLCLDLSREFDPLAQQYQGDDAVRQQWDGFLVVVLVGAGRMPAEGEDEREEARLLYVGATRATRQLVIGANGTGKFASRI